MDEIHVGERYYHFTSPPEGIQYKHDARGHILEIFLSDPSTAQVSAAQKGRWQFALFTQEPVMFLCFRAKHLRFCPIPWNAAPLEDPSSYMFTPQTIGEDQRATIQMIFVDADTGLVRAHRMIPLPPAFSRNLHSAIRNTHTAIRNKGSGPLHHNFLGVTQQAIRDARRAHPTAASMAQAASTTCWVGR